MADSTLAAIQKKVRRLTRSPSEAQLTTTELNEYINVALLFDFPQHNRLFSLRKTLTFYTQPGVDVYRTNTTDVNDPLYDFQNRYITVHPGAYISGLAAFYTQERDVFFGNYPMVTSVVDTALRGNGTTGPFSGTLTSAFALQNSVIFTALNAAGTAMILIDYPQDNVIGYLGIPNQTDILVNPYGTISYETGAYSFDFPQNTDNSSTNIIYSEAQYYKRGLPTSMLYFDNSFTLRPVPDKAYPVQIQVDATPTELLSSSQSPQIHQWFQFIAYLAAKKIFEDRMDMDSVQMIMPEFMKQMNLVLRTSIDTQANERTVTIYTQGKNYGWGWNNWGNWPF